MAQFDVYENPGADWAPFLLDVQHKLLSSLATRVVVPLARPGVLLPITDLNPVVELGGQELVVVTQEMASVLTASLGAQVGSLFSERLRIIRALDTLVTGP